jgi:hypothetical protein
MAEPHVPPAEPRGLCPEIDAAGRYCALLYGHAGAHQPGSEYTYGGATTAQTIVRNYRGAQKRRAAPAWRELGRGQCPGRLRWRDHPRPRVGTDHALGPVRQPLGRCSDHVGTNPAARQVGYTPATEYAAAVERIGDFIGGKNHLDEFSLDSRGRLTHPMRKR